MTGLDPSAPIVQRGPWFDEFEVGEVCAHSHQQVKTATSIPEVTQPRSRADTPLTERSVRGLVPARALPGNGRGHPRARPLW